MDMYNNSISIRSREPVTNLLEIRLCQNTWERIKSIAIQRDRTCSWVIRYLLFRMIKRKSFEKIIDGYGSSEIEARYNEKSLIAKEKKYGASKSHHRYNLCLHGSDEVAIRLAAIQIRCTMTHLVRLAIEWYIEELEEKTNSGNTKLFDLFFFYLGIKHFKTLEFHSPNLSNKSFLFCSYTSGEYWKKPGG